MPDPVFHFILVVDLEGFGGRKIPAQSALRKIMYEVVKAAFEATQLDWATTVRLDRGDSIILLLPTSAGNSVTLAGAFIVNLNEELKNKAQMYAAELRMRMRVALHQGNCQRDDTGWVGEAINTSARLVDAEILRSVLKKATKAMMALIVSEEIYRSVIRHDFRHIESASYAQVRLDAKEVHETAWIHVPGYSYPPGITDIGPSGGPFPEGPSADGSVPGGPTRPGGPTPGGPASEEPESVASRASSAFYQSNRGGLNVQNSHLYFEGDQVGGNKIVGGDHR